MDCPGGGNWAIERSVVGRFGINRMRTVGIFISPHSARGMGLLRGVGRFVRSQGDWLVISIDRDKSTSFSAVLENRRCEGVLASIEASDEMQLLDNSALPVVDVYGRFESQRIARVVVDHHRVGLLAYAHLKSCGLSNLAFYGFAKDRACIVRLDAVMQCARADQLNVAVSLNHADLRSGHTADSATGDSADDSAQSEPELEEWLTKLPKPVGVIAGNDLLGKRLLEACRRSGLQVPDIVAVIGAGSDEVFREFCVPALSSVPIPNERIGYQAAELLSTLMDGKVAAGHEIRINPGAVMVRRSTRGPVSSDAGVLMAVKFIQENACNGINTEDVLDHLAQNSHLISRSTLERRFREALRHSPKDEILRVRIARAGELLMNTSYPLAKIAEMVSIQRPEHLSATFKRLTGQLPGELRRDRGRGERQI